MRSRFTVIAVAFALAMGSGTAVAVQPYSITDLGTLGADSGSLGINNLGQVVGTSRSVAGGDYHGFLWLPEAAYGLSAGINDMESLPGFPGSAAIDINDSGQIVGNLQPTGGPVRTFIWDEIGGMTEIPNTLGGTGVELFDINNSGQVAGSAHIDAGGTIRAVLWEDGVGMTDLGILSGGWSSYGKDVNNLGQVVGTSSYSNGSTGDHVFLWLPEAAYGLAAGINDLGSLPGYTNSEGRTINDLGQIAGWAYGNDKEALLWLPEPAYGLQAGMNNIGGLPGYEHTVIRDINNSGQIVGYAAIGGTEPRAVLWENGVFYDLNNLVPTDSSYELIQTASAINDNGQIACTAVLDGTYRAILLTPIPEPATLGLLLIGSLALLRRRRTGEILQENGAFLKGNHHIPRQQKNLQK